MLSKRHWVEASFLTQKISEVGFSIRMTTYHRRSCVSHILGQSRPCLAPLSPVEEKFDIFYASQVLNFLLTSGSGRLKRTVQDKEPLFFKRQSLPHLFPLPIHYLSVITFSDFSNLCGYGLGSNAECEQE